MGGGQAEKVAFLQERQVVFGLATCPPLPTYSSEMEPGIALRQGTSEGAELPLLCPWAAHWLGPQQCFAPPEHHCQCPEHCGGESMALTRGDPPGGALTCLSYTNFFFKNRPLQARGLANWSGHLTQQTGGGGGRHHICFHHSSPTPWMGKGMGDREAEDMWRGGGETSELEYGRVGGAGTASGQGEQHAACYLRHQEALSWPWQGKPALHHQNKGGHLGKEALWCHFIFRGGRKTVPIHSSMMSSPVSVCWGVFFGIIF